MIKLVLIRHGQSVWNQENRFTGWHDVELSDQGRSEAKRAGELLKAKKYEFDLAYTSVLKRAIDTLSIVLEELGQTDLPIVRDWRLNERHYGALTGLNKAETAKKYGDEQVRLWRRSYATRPPLLDENSPYYPGKQKVYADLPKEKLPLGECLKDTVERFVPYYQTEIVPHLREGKRLLIAAHGNSLRALVKHLDSMSDEEITRLNIPTGVPLVYELDDSLRAKKHYYLGDAEQIQKAAASVAAHGSSG